MSRLTAGDTRTPERNIAPDLRPLDIANLLRMDGWTIRRRRGDEIRDCMCLIVAERGRELRNVCDPWSSESRMAKKRCLRSSRINLSEAMGGAYSFADDLEIWRMDPSPRTEHPDRSLWDLVSEGDLLPTSQGLRLTHFLQGTELQNRCALVCALFSFA